MIDDIKLGKGRGQSMVDVPLPIRVELPTSLSLHCRGMLQNLDTPGQTCPLKLSTSTPIPPTRHARHLRRLARSVDVDDYPREGAERAQVERPPNLGPCRRSNDVEDESLKVW